MWNWTNPRIDLLNIRDSLCSLFSRMCLEIADLPDGEDVHAVRGEAQFLLGGWRMARAATQNLETLLCQRITILRTPEYERR